MLAALRSALLISFRLISRLISSFLFSSLLVFVVDCLCVPTKTKHNQFKIETPLGIEFAVRAAWAAWEGEMNELEAEQNKTELNQTG